MLIAVAGLLTFFWPLVTTDPTVAGTTHWSCFDIIVQMYKGVLTAPVCERCGVPWVRALLALPLDFDAAYVLLAFMVIVLSLRVPAQLVIWFPLIWISVAIRWRYGTRMDFENTFFGSSGNGHVHYGALLATHVVAMGALFLACLDLRGEEPLDRPRNRSRLRVEPREPQMIDAEIVDENEPANRPHRDPQRPHE
jgi:hypothetical protein